MHTKYGRTSSCRPAYGCINSVYSSRQPLAAAAALAAAPAKAMLSLLAAAFVALAAPPFDPRQLPKGGADCRNAADCSLTGSCVGAKCACDAAWTGPACEQLHLLPARRSALYPAGGHATELPSNRSFVWGGSVIKDDATGIYHLFVTEFMNKCPMTYGTWQIQSSVRHATATTANGPWEPKELVLQAAAGNPAVARAPDGTYVMYFTNVQTGPKHPRDCTSANRSEWGPPRYCTKEAHCDAETGLHLAHSKSLNGPWTVQLNIADKSIAGTTNPGVIFLPSGETLLTFKGSAAWPAKTALCPKGSCRSIGVVFAPTWNAWPYKRFLSSGASVHGGRYYGGGAVLEDPSNGYVDTTRGALHTLFHQGLPTTATGYSSGGPTSSGCQHGQIGGIPASNTSCGFGGAAHSADNGTTWTYATKYWTGGGWLNGTKSSFVYAYETLMDGGSTINCLRREEPKLLIEDGEPSALITQCSVTALGTTQPTKAHPEGEIEWSTVLIVQPINTKKTQQLVLKSDDERAPMLRLNNSRYLPLLFVDDSLFESSRGGMSLRVQSPTVGPVVISADKPWESWAIGGYNHAMKFGPEDFRLYYACIEYNNHTHGSFGQIEERLCLARSSDGVSWRKPPLGKYSWGVHGQASNTDNNILLPCYEVSVFEDLNPTTKPEARYKMLCGKGIYESPNGIDWNHTGSGKISHADDTMDTGWFDPAIGKYVIYVRRDLEIAGRNCSGKYESTKNTCRLVGRCETTDLYDWEQGNPEGCPAVFGPDAEDPMGIDLYTSGFAPYEGVQLFFPAAMYSFGHRFPWGYGNDGLLDIRFAASRDGRTIRYVPGAANAREPWFELGLNRCGTHTSAPDSYRGGWCDPGDQGQMSRTDPHTTTNYMVGGLMQSPTGEEVFMYVASPGAMGHGEIFTEPPVEPVTRVPSVRPQLGNNSAISLLRVRKHGFVAAEGPSRPLLPLVNTTGCRPKADYPSAAGPSELYPGFTTVALDVPDNCHDGHLVLVVNAKTSVAGFVQIGVIASQANNASAQYRLCNSDPLRGNFLAATASWGGGSVRTLPTRGDDQQSVQLEVILVAAKLFSLQFKCTALLARRESDG
jgi:hypothetical protein